MIEFFVTPGAVDEAGPEVELVAFEHAEATIPITNAAEPSVRTPRRRATFSIPPVLLFRPVAFVATSGDSVIVSRRLATPAWS
jgi:hypothetical protein